MAIDASDRPNDSFGYSVYAVACQLTDQPFRLPPISRPTRGRDAHSGDSGVAPVADMPLLLSMCGRRSVH